MAASRRPLRVRAFAKINLHLRILGRRPDGYHDIDSVMHRIAWGDEIELLPRPDGELRLVLEAGGRPEAAAGPDVPPGPENLAWRAARWLQRTFGVATGAEIRLRKRVAVGAGLGGGSADAAAVIRGLRRLWRLRVPAERLRVMAAAVGADVPFLLGLRAARVQGMGERLESLPPWPGLFLVLVTLPRPVSTAWAYAAWDRRAGGGPAGAAGRDDAGAGAGREPGRDAAGEDGAAAEAFVRAFRARDLAGLARLAANDFEPVVAARVPEVEQALAALRREGALVARMTGSGPTVWGLFPGRAAAVRAWRRLLPAYPGARVVRTL